MIFMGLLLMTATSALIACNPNDEPVMETPVTPVPDPEEPENEMSKNMTIRVGDRSFAATLEKNATARAFAELLPMTVTMNEMNGNEKYHYLSKNLPTDSYRPGTIRSGDLMLYGSGCVVLFYETFSSPYSYTRIGRLDDPSGLGAALGKGDVSVTFEIDND